MTIELINTGTELMLGSRINSHHPWIARRLLEHGYMLTRQAVTVDTGSAIRDAVREALGRSDVVITTGGLGPTSDDVTREMIAELLGCKLHEDPEILAHLRGFFEQRGRTMPGQVRGQAQVPEGATILENAHGTAPGLAFHLAPNPFRPGDASALLVMLPGPPRELYPMFDDQVVPLLKAGFPLRHGCDCRNLRTTGLGESAVEEAIREPLGALMAEGLEVAYCLAPGSVDVRLSAVGAEARSVIDRAEATIRGLIGERIYAVGEYPIEAVLVRTLAESGLTLALAESCTGGFIAHRVTNVPGASAVLRAGWVTYSNEAKQRCLGVASETLQTHGAVSEPTAREMAAGARRESGADFALSVTGIAGPGGGSDDKPVGTVYIGLASESGVTVRKFLHPCDRETFKIIASQQALELLRQTLLKRK